MAAVHVEQNDDKAQAVTGQVGATKELGQSPCAVLPSRHLTKNNRKAEHRRLEMMVCVSLTCGGERSRKQPPEAKFCVCQYTDGLINTAQCFP